MQRPQRRCFCPWTGDCRSGGKGSAQVRCASDSPEVVKHVILRLVLVMRVVLFRTL